MTRTRKSRYQKNKNVSFTYFGDGAANQGQVYETFNMASLWKLPVVFIIENNQYAMGTSIQRSSATSHLYSRGAAFDIPGELVDGMDIIKVYNASKKAASYCRQGKGPYILEMSTYRYKGHSMSDPAKYRTREEVQNMKEKKDPIENLQKIHLKEDYSQESLKEIDLEVKSLVSEAAQFSLDSPEPDISELYKNIYAVDS